MNVPLGAELEAYAAAGFRRVELWLEKLRKDGRKATAIARLLKDNGLEPVASCGTCQLVWPGAGDLGAIVGDFKRDLEWAQALGVPQHVVCDWGGGRPTPADYQRGAERLRAIAEIAAGYGVRVAFEFLARGAFLGSLTSALAVLREAAHPHAGLCLDTFHFFAGVSKTEDLDALRPGEVTHVHFHDVPGGLPREILVDAHRLPAGEGVIPLGRIVDALHRVGYRGALSTELFGPEFQNGDPLAVARRCYQALEPFCARRTC